MQVSAVHNIEQDMIRSKESFPTTFYTLDAEEQTRYDHFFERYRSILEFFAQYKQGMSPREERNQREEELQTLFRDFVAPTLNADGFQHVNVLGALYGNNPQIVVETAAIQLFNPEEKTITPVAYQVKYSFHIEPERLTATSHLQYAPQQGEMTHQRQTVIDDLIRKLLLEEQGDGITTPLTKSRGNGLYFASTKFAFLILASIRKMIGALGNDAVEELEILNGSYHNEYGEGRRADIRRNAFKNAYDTLLEQEALKSGLKEWKTN